MAAQSSGAVNRRLVDDLRSEVVRMHRAADQRMQQRLKAFDGRAAQRLVGALETPETLEEEDVEPLRTLDLHLRREGNEQRRSLLEGVPSQHQEIEMIDKEVPLECEVIRWSSQKQQYPASTLVHASGVWEAAPMRTKNEYVVLMLESPGCVHGVEMGLPGDDSGPHLCRMHFSKKSPDGPWMEAWRFEVSSKAVASYRSVFDYDRGASADQFVRLCASAFEGGIRDAWDQILDVNHDGRLSYAEFVNACNRIRNLPEVREAGSLLTDLPQLFEELDLDESGEVTLCDLQSRVGLQGRPEAMFWKLTVRSNFGSVKRLQIAAPLKLYALIKVPATIVGTMLLEGMTLYPRYDRKQEVDCVNAFTLETLKVNPTSVMMRRLADKHSLNFLDLEVLHKSFVVADVSGRGTLEVSEFNQLIKWIYGAGDGDIPTSRMRLFWQHADSNHNGLVDFEEFVVWFRKYSKDISDKGTRGTMRRISHGIVRGGCPP